MIRQMTSSRSAITCRRRGVYGHGTEPGQCPPEVQVLARAPFTSSIFGSRPREAITEYIAIGPISESCQRYSEMGDRVATRSLFKVIVGSPSPGRTCRAKVNEAKPNLAKGRTASGSARAWSPEVRSSRGVTTDASDVGG